MVKALRRFLRPQRPRILTPAAEEQRRTQSSRRTFAPAAAAGPRPAAFSPTHRNSPCRRGGSGGRSGRGRRRAGQRSRSWDGSTDEPPASQSWADWSVQQADLAQKRGVTCIGAERVEPRIPNKLIKRGILQRCGPVEFRECFVLPPKLSVDLRAGIICLVVI